MLLDIYMALCKKYFKIWKEDINKKKVFLYKALQSFEMFDIYYNGYLDVENIEKASKILYLKYNLDIPNKSIVEKYHTSHIQKTRNEMIELRDEIKSLKDLKNTVNEIKNNIDINNELWSDFDKAVNNLNNKKKYYFKDYLSFIISTNNELKNNKFYAKEIKDYLNGEKAICICSSIMSLEDINNCYDNNINRVVCDFNGKIINKNILHCKCSYCNNHPTGFDIDKKNVELYMDDLINRRLERRLYFKLTELNDSAENRNYLEKKYKDLCNSILQQTIHYYLGCKSDLINLLYSSNIKPSYILKLKTRLLNYKRILSTETEWLNIIHKKIDKVRKTIIIYKNFIDNLKPYPGIFITKTDQNDTLKKYKTRNSNFIKDFDILLKNIDKLNTISYEVLQKDSLRLTTIQVAKINDLIYKSFDAINTLENATSNDEMIKFTKIVLEKPEICIICQSECTEIDKDNVKLDKCIHVFHKKCFLNWLVRSNTCPLCR